MALRHQCFPVNFAKHLRAFFYRTPPVPDSDTVNIMKMFYQTSPADSSQLKVLKDALIQTQIPSLSFSFPSISLDIIKLVNSLLKEISAILSDL